MNSFLDVDRVVKRYGARTALRDVSLAVERGELLVLLGASGSGKSTLLRTICGFERVDSGTIAIDGRTVAGPGAFVPPERRRIGYVAQEGALFPHLSVGANVAFGLRRPLRTVVPRVTELLDLVGLSSAFVARSPETLSGGEQQRVAVARALAPSPALVLLDEPFSALDAALRVETRTAVAHALAAAGATAVLVTHDQAEALSLADHVAVLRDGRIVQVDAPRTLYARPVDAALAGFVGEAMVLPAQAENGVARCALGTIALVAGSPSGPVDVLLRPEHLAVASTAEGSGGAAPPADGSGGVAARVTAVRFYGSSASLALVPTGARADAAPLTALVSGLAVPAVGAEVAIALRGETVAFARTTP